MAGQICELKLTDMQRTKRFFQSECNEVNTGGAYSRMT